MFVARDANRGAVVSGPEVGQSTTDPLSTTEDKFECVVCGSPLEYIEDSTDDYFGYFDNKQCNCVKDGNMSKYHRLAEEVITKELINLLPVSPERIDIDVEGRIGTATDFVVADICLRYPAKLAVEVIYTNKNIQLRRRLGTLSRADYSVTFVMLDNSTISRETINSQLQEFGDFRVGTFEPQSLNLDFGSIINPGIVSHNGLQETG